MNFPSLLLSLRACIDTAEMSSLTRKLSRLSVSESVSHFDRASLMASLAKNLQLPILSSEADIHASMSKLAEGGPWNLDQVRWVLLKDLDFDRKSFAGPAEALLLQAREHGDFLILLKDLLTFSNEHSRKDALIEFFHWFGFKGILIDDQLGIVEALNQLSKSQIVKVFSHLVILIMGKNHNLSHFNCHDIYAILREDIKLTKAELRIIFHLYPTDPLERVQGEAYNAVVVEELYQLAKIHQTDLDMWSWEQPDWVARVLNVLRSIDNNVASYPQILLTKVVDHYYSMIDNFYRSGEPHLSCLRLLAQKDLIPKDQIIPQVWWSKLAMIYPEVIPKIPIPESLANLRGLIPRQRNQNPQEIIPWLQALLDKHGHEALVKAWKDTEDYPRNTTFYLAMITGKFVGKSAIVVAHAFPDFMDEELQYYWWLYHFRRLIQADKIFYVDGQQSFLLGLPYDAASQ